MTEPGKNLNGTAEELEIDLREIISLLKKRIKLIIAGTLLCAITAGLISYFVLPPVYQAKTLLMVTQATERIQSNVRQTEGLEDVVSSVSQMPAWTLNTYLGQIKSEALMKRIISKLELDPALYTPGSISGMIEATVVKDSNLLDIKVNNGDPQLAKDIANALSTEYVDFMTQKNQEQMDRSMSFLNHQKKLNDTKLQKAQEELKKFNSEPRGVAVLESQFNNITENMVNFRSLLTMAQVETQQITAGITSLEAELAGIPEVITNENIDETGNMFTTQESNPLYLSLAEQLANKNTSLAEKQGEIAGLQALMDSMTAEIDLIQAELAEKKLKEEILLQDVERLSKTSETLAQKAAETQIAKSIDIGNTSVLVISEASLPTGPVKPNKKLNTAIGFILGLMVFTLLAFVLEYLDNTLKTPEDVTRELELPVLGVIPKATKANTK